MRVLCALAVTALALCELSANPDGLVTVPDQKTCGVNYLAMSQEDRYTISGKEISRADALALLGVGAESKNVPDVSGLLRLTVIGSEPERKAVESDLRLNPALAGWLPRLSLQTYAPDNAWVTRARFPVAGTSIVIQSPSGRVLARNRDGVYRGPTALHNALHRVWVDPQRGAARPAGASYSADKDADLWGQQPCPGPGPCPMPSPPNPPSPPSPPPAPPAPPGPPIPMPVPAPMPGPAPWPWPMPGPAPAPVPVPAPAPVPAPVAPAKPELYAGLPSSTWLLGGLAAMSWLVVLAKRDKP